MSIEEIGKNLPALLGALLIAVLFIQSGLDKVIDWKGNLEWLNGHFSKTFLSSIVPLMLVKLTILELTVGLMSAAGVIYFLATGTTLVIFWGSALGALTVVGLFFGQRVAKDYPGAAVLVPYFLLLIALVYLTNPYIKP